MDLLSAIFLGCFVFGFVAVLGSFLLGGVHGMHFGGVHLDLRGSTSTSASGDTSRPHGCARRPPRPQRHG